MRLLFPPLACAPAVCAVLLMAPVGAGARPVGDADRVLCLSTDHRRDLVDAAVALELASSTPDPAALVPSGADRPVSLLAWSRVEPDAFGDACTALVAAMTREVLPTDRPTSDAPVTSWLPGLSAFGGALLGALVSTLAGYRARRRTLAELVHSRGTEFHQAVTAHLQAQIRTPAERDLRAAEVLRTRNEAVAVLDRVAGKYPRWRAPGELRSTIRGDVLGDALLADLPVDADERDLQEQAIRNASEAAEQRFATVAELITRFFRRNLHG